MSERTPLLFAPGLRSGFHENRGCYSTVLGILERSGFAPYFFQPNWNNPHPQEWAAEMAAAANEVAKEHAAASVALGGFSCGALVAVLATSRMERSAADTQVAGLLACSMSPWFGLERVRRAHQQPVSDLHGTAVPLNAGLSALELPKLHAPAQVYVGSQEISTMHDIHDDALQAWSQAISIRPATQHNIFDESYLQAIERHAGSLITG